jgi:hypothetical protein
MQGRGSEQTHGTRLCGASMTLADTSLQLRLLAGSKAGVCCRMLTYADVCGASMSLAGTSLQLRLLVGSKKSKERLAARKARKVSKARGRAGAWPVSSIGV